MFTQLPLIKDIDNKWPDLMPLVIVLASAFILYFIGLNTFGIIDPGEAYYAEAAREMVQSGDYVTPHLNYQIYFSKPILTFWIISFAYKVLGISEFSTRVIFALLISLLLAAVYWLGRSLASRRCGIFAALIAATMPIMLACAKLSPIDIAFACFLDLFVLALAFSVCLDQRGCTPFVYFFLGLAALTKGPAAFVLAALGILIFLVAERAEWSINIERLKKLNLPLGLVILAAIILPWYYAVGCATHGLFLKVFLLYENLARFAGMTNMAHTTWYHYGLVSIYGLFPWILFLPQSLWFAIKPVCAGRKLSAAARALLLLTCWSLSVFVFFSISRTQLDTYILPVAAPLAVVIAFYIDALINRLYANDTSKRTMLIISSVFGLIGFLVIVFAFALPSIAVPKTFVDAIASQDLLSIKICLFILGIILAVGYISQYYFFWKRHYVMMFAVLITTSLVVAAGASQAAFQILDQSGQKDLRLLCIELSKSCDQLAVFQAFKPSIMFYSGKPVTSFFHVSQLVPTEQAENRTDNFEDRKSGCLPRLLIILHEKSMPLFTVSPPIKLQLVKHQGPWLVYQVANAKFEEIQTLAAMFSNWQMVEKLVKSQNAVGPLTVPYAAGDPCWWRTKKER